MIERHETETQKEETDFFDDISEELGYPPEDKTEQRAIRSDDAGVSPRLIMAGSAGAVVLIALMAFFFAGASEVSQSDLAILKSGLDRIETRLVQLEGLNKRMNSLEKEVGRIKASVGNTRTPTARTETPAPAPSTPKEYYTVRSGDSLYHIAKRHGLTVARLCQLNDMNPKKPIQPGQRLLVTP